MNSLSDIVKLCDTLPNMRFGVEGDMCVRQAGGRMTAQQCLAQLNKGQMFSCKDGMCYPDPQGTITKDRCERDPRVCQSPFPTERFSCGDKGFCVPDVNGSMSFSDCKKAGACKNPPGPPVKTPMFSCGANGQCVEDPNGSMTIERCWNDPLACHAPPHPGMDLDCNCSCMTK